MRGVNTEGFTSATFNHPSSGCRLGTSRMTLDNARSYFTFLSDARLMFWLPAAALLGPIIVPFPPSLHIVS
ncbi:hypothetical protein CALCODRAFT_85367 [Calocera cornea HHB12733]|uniref:Uncharacterized protein n=1 Tax=Calocera cornea HHB12733 TaxID=1353952 RepID=A0A165INT1_9BASI|nr:hypothetical protein CALCODRAFT_85367 [Calocera cornea HHB12733]